MLLVGSRNMMVSINNTVTNIVVPLADMINHADPHTVKWFFNDTRQGFQLKTISPIK